MLPFPKEDLCILIKSELIMKIIEELNFLLLLLTVLLLTKIAYPALSSLAEALIAVLLISFAFDFIKRKIDISKKNREIDKKCNEFWQKRDEIKKKFDPFDEWNSFTVLPAEYKDEMRELNDAYKSVLDERRHR